VEEEEVLEEGVPQEVASGEEAAEAGDTLVVLSFRNVQFSSKLIRRLKVFIWPDSDEAFSSFVIECQGHPYRKYY
jgi:hypothetical protein